MFTYLHIYDIYNNWIMVAKIRYKMFDLYFSNISRKTTKYLSAYVGT